MKGLIINDLLSIRKIWKTMLLISIFFGVIWTVGGQPEIGVVMIGTIAISWLLNLFSYDEYYHWDDYARILPVSKKQIVLARYSMFGIMMLVSLVFSLIYLAVFGGLDSEGISSIAGMLFIQLYTTIVIVPACYKFGIQKGRMVYTVFMIIPFVIILGAVQLASLGFGINISREIRTIALIAVPPIMLLAIFASIKLSISIVTKKAMQ